MATTFKTLIEVMGVEPPTTRASIEIWHESQAGFGVRIMKPRADGKVRRSYIGRIDVLQPDGKLKEDKPVLGLVEDIGSGDAVLKFKDAQDRARKLLETSKRLKAGGAVRMTVGDAYEKLVESLDSQHSGDSDTFAKKLRGTYGRFLAHLEGRYLDSLKEGFWVDYLRALRDGALTVSETAEDGTVVEVPREAKSASYALAVLNTASRLYRLAHTYKGIEGEEKGWDPTRDAAALIEAPNVRKDFVKFPDLAKAWAATDQLMSPWWRDMWRVYLLTGLRDKLVMDMRWEQIDFERGLYLIKPLQQGTKRRKLALSQNERKEPIPMPLSSYVLSILRRRKQFAPPGKAGEWVWYSTETKRRRKTKDLPRLTDPRASWQRLEPVIGYWTYKHGLRRTFSSIGATVDASNILALSLLMMHSSKGVAKALGVPEITIKYIQAQQASMRATTERITQAVLELVGEAPQTALTAAIRDYERLPQALEQALVLEEKAPERSFEDTLEDE